MNVNISNANDSHQMHCRRNLLVETSYAADLFGIKYTLKLHLGV